MMRLRNLLIAVILLEVLIGGSLVARRLWNPAPPAPNLAQLDSLTMQQLTQVRQRARHGGWEEWRNYAQALLGQGFYAEAEQAFRVAVHLNPDDQETIYGLAFCLERVGRLEESIPVLKQVAAMSNDELSQTCWYQIGRGHLRLEQVSAAEQAFQRVEEFPAAAYHLAKIQIRTGRAAEAVPIIEQSLQQFPNSLKLIQLRARAAEELGDLETAWEFYDREMRAEAKLTLEYGMSFFNLYRAKYGLERHLANCVRLRNSGTLSEQVNCIERGLHIVRSENLIQYAPVYVAAAEILLGLGQLEQTRSLLEELQSLEYETHWTLQLQGELMFQLKEPQLARQAWERSISLRPTPAVQQRLAIYFDSLGEIEQATRHRAKAHQLLGLEDYQANRIDQAHQQFQSALDLVPTMAKSWYYLGETHRLRGKRDQAQSAYERCLELDAHYQRARLALDRLLDQKKSEPAVN